MRVPREPVEGYALEYEIVRHPGAAREPIVFLHHGFGSISTWKDFPTQVGQRLGRFRAGRRAAHVAAAAIR